jgi:hypothetical protein
MTNENGDDLLTCSDCGTAFAFEQGEQQFYRDRGFPPPKRCPACRAVRRQKRDALAARGREYFGQAIGTE